MYQPVTWKPKSFIIHWCVHNKLLEIGDNSVSVMGKNDKLYLGHSLQHNISDVIGILLPFYMYLAVSTWMDILSIPVNRLSQVIETVISHPIIQRFPSAHCCGPPRSARCDQSGQKLTREISILPLLYWSENRVNYRWQHEIEWRNLYCTYGVSSSEKLLFKYEPVVIIIIIYPAAVRWTRPRQTLTQAPWQKNTTIFPA